MAKKRMARVLFFTQDAKPTDREYELADKLGSNVNFRNGRIARAGGKPEACEAVAAVKGDLIPNVYAVANVPRVKTMEDVARLRPTFTRDIGYSDDEEDTGYAGPNVGDLPSALPSTENEPGIGLNVGEGAAAEAARLASEALAAENGGNGGDGGGTDQSGGTGEPFADLVIPEGHEAVIGEDGKRTGETKAIASAPPPAPPKTTAKKATGTPPPPASGTTPPPAGSPPAWGKPPTGNGSQTT